MRRELEAHPECAESLRKEWELSLAPQDFQRLADETRMAGIWIAASSFTRATLIENGVDGGRVHVVPYGIDLEQFRPAASSRMSGPLRLLFVGTINQRKGIRYLLEALRSFPAGAVELRVCGRAVDDLQLFREFGSQVTIAPSVSRRDLIGAYQAADLFVFPSVAEGFGQVLLEALACGLPVLSTTRTAAADLVREGREGFVVEPCRADVLTERIEWALAHRGRLHEMRGEARERAEVFTWQRFRSSIVEMVRGCAEESLTSPVQEVLAQHV